MSKEIGKEFVEKTKYHYLAESDQMRGLVQPSLELSYDNENPTLDLPEPAVIQLGSAELGKVIGKRRSIRSYTRKALSLQELSYLLWCTQGVQEVIPGSATFRTVPSAGARHALETYLLANNVDPLPKGLYRYLALEHKLLEVNREEKMADRIVEACLGQQFVKTSAVTFVWTAVVGRMKWRYGERGYRYLYLDAGHVCQNLYLSAESIDCGVCAIGAFSDDDMNRLLDLNGVERFVIYLAALGKK